MNLGIENKVAVVTGASKGIGKAVAETLAAEGCKVVICARGEDELNTVAEGIRNMGAECLPVVADVTRMADIERLFDETVQHYGTIHILVNNAGGIGRPAHFEELSDQEWLGLFELNVLSAVRATRLAVPHMQKQQWGRIINIASESGIQPDPHMPHYNATKAAMINLTKSLSKAYGKDNILVNTVSPAFIKTPLVEDLLVEMAARGGYDIAEAETTFLANNRPNIVIGRAGTIEESAGIVAFLASEQAAFITGSNYRVDGGSVASV